MSSFMKDLLRIWMSFQIFQMFMGLVGLIIVLLLLLAIQHGSRRAASEARDRSEVEEAKEHDTAKLGAEFTTIRIEQTVANRAIAFSEIQVFDTTGENIALGKPVSGSSVLPNYPTANAVDGNKSTFVQTANESKAFLDIDFGVAEARTKQIDRVMLYNFASMQERAIGVRLLIMFQGAPFLATKPIDVARDEYEFPMNSFELIEPDDAQRGT